MIGLVRKEEGVNRARKQLFSKKGRAIVGLPPTLAALIDHNRELPISLVIVGAKG